MADFPDPALVAALQDPDDRARRLAGRDLVLWTLRRSRNFEHPRVVVLEALACADAELRQRVEAALDALAPEWDRPGFFTGRMVPIYAEAVGSVDAAVAEAALWALDRVGGNGQPLGGAVEAVARRLGTEARPALRGLAVRVLRHAARNGVDVGLGARALHDAMETEPDDVRFAAAEALALQAARDRDARRVSRLLGHEALAVRQGAAESLSLAARSAMDLGFAMEGLARAALDEAGGVSFHALKAIREAALRGTDVSAALGALRVCKERRSYATSGWFGELYAEERSELAAHSPARDAGEALSFQERNHPGSG